MNKMLHKIFKFYKDHFCKQYHSSGLRNPWAGLTSYEDPINNNQDLKFCGRDEDILELFRLIDDNLVVTLYGKCGIGKTSLLNAGVFPRLRQNQYIPFYIRFASSTEEDYTYGEQLTNLITEQFKSKFGKESIEIIDIVPECTNPKNEDYLWSFFARRRFKDIDGNYIFPVIVLDQFEEIIRINRLQTTILLKQIAYMSNRQNRLRESFVDGRYYIYNYNFRFVISIREDDLYSLEDLINTNYLSALKSGRYRLENLTNENALLVIQNVGADYIDHNDIDRISDQIINISKNKEDGLIQTNAVSLICSRLFDLVLEKGEKIITLQDVESYLSKDPFEEYYETATHKLSESEKRFIETNLVSADGRRNLLPETIVKESIKSFKTLINGKTLIFHRVHSSSGVSLIELIHDGLCSTVLKNRTIRLERKNQTIFNLALIIFGLLAIWMLNTSIINNFVHLYCKLIDHFNVLEISYIDLLTITEFIFVFLCPLALGSAIFDYRKKKIVAVVAILLFFLPISFFPRTSINFAEKFFSQIIIDFKIGGFSYTTHNISENTYIFIVYAIAICILSVSNGLGKTGILRNDNFYKSLWRSRSFRIYYLIIAIYLFYKSIFNSEQFTINSYDSSWGVLIIPLLSLSIFKTNFIKISNTVALYLYVLFLTGLMICSICEFHISFITQIYFLSISTIILFFIFFHNNFFVAAFKSIINVLFLTIVLFLHNGYNPLIIDSQHIQKVYPWKIIISEENKYFSVYDAFYGDTLLVPVFNHNSYFYKFYTTLPNNSYTDSIKTLSVAEPSISFPLKLNKNENGKWVLSLIYLPEYEHAICNLAHSQTNDTIELSNKFGAELFIKLRNDISKFCISGDESILLSDVIHIIAYENVIKNTLNNSLRNFSANDSIATEKDIVLLLKALSRSLYINMLKEAILRHQYNNFINWFSIYYLPASLTNITSLKNIGWSSTFNYNLNVSLNSNNDMFSSHQSNSFTINLSSLNDDKVYAWNNLFSAFFLLEYNAYAPYFYSEREKNINNNFSIIENISNNTTTINNLLTSINNSLLTQNHRLKEILSELTELKKSDEGLSNDNMVQTLMSIIEINKMSNNINNNTVAEIDTYNTNISALSDSLRGIALQQADIEFKNFVTNTFNHMLKIINNNPINVYNGLLISLCQRLYVIGIIRGYDMEVSAKQLDIIEESSLNPLYVFVRKNEEIYKNHLQYLESVRSRIEIINSLLNKQ